MAVAYRECSTGSKGHTDQSRTDFCLGGVEYFSPRRARVSAKTAQARFFGWSIACFVPGSLTSLSRTVDGPTRSSQGSVQVATAITAAVEGTGPKIAAT
jgi:hypothetical protein